MRHVLIIILLPVIAVFFILYLMARPNKDLGVDEEYFRSSLMRYQNELLLLNPGLSNVNELQQATSFIFGMGNRQKYIFRDSSFSRLGDDTPVKTWSVDHYIISPSDFAVFLKTTDGKGVEIYEDANAIWIVEEGEKDSLMGSNIPLRLPEFKGFEFQRALRVLHHEMMVSICDSVICYDFCHLPVSNSLDKVVVTTSLYQTKHHTLISNNNYYLASSIELKQDTVQPPVSTWPLSCFNNARPCYPDPVKAARLYMRLLDVKNYTP